MRIAYIDSTYGTGSIGRLTKELADAMIEKGHQVHYYYAQGYAEASYSTKISSRNAQKVHAVLSRITGLQGYFSWFGTIRLIQYLRKFKPDIVHLQNLHSNYINLRMLLEYLGENHISTVFTLHDCWYYTGKCTSYIPAKCKKWMTGCGHCPLLHFDNVNPTLLFDTTHKCLQDKKKWFSRIEKLAVVGVSDWVTDEARKSIYKEKRIYRIYNWIDQQIFCYRGNERRKLIEKEYPDTIGKKIILMVSANLSRKKGYDELVELAEVLKEKYTIIYIGRNKQGLTVPDHVIHVEHTDNAVQLAEYYSAADVCVNTTQYETFGMVTVEAMSCGIPVIVYNNTASPELITSGCGVVVEQSEGVIGIVNALNVISSWDCDITRERCIEYAKSNFNKQIATEKYAVLYSNLL